MLENIDGEVIDGEEAIAIDAAFENVLVNIRTYKLAKLKVLCKATTLFPLAIRLCSFSRFGTRGVSSSSELMTNPLSTKRKRGKKLIHLSRNG